MGLRLQFFGYGLKNSIDIFQDVIVPKADHPIALRFQKVRPDFVSLAVRVLAAVDFDYQPAIAAKEVADIGSDRHLA